MELKKGKLWRFVIRTSWRNMVHRIRRKKKMAGDRRRRRLLFYPVTFFLLIFLRARSCERHYWKFHRLILNSWFAKWGAKLRGGNMILRGAIWEWVVNSEVFRVGLCSGWVCFLVNTSGACTVCMHKKIFVRLYVHVHNIRIFIEVTQYLYKYWKTF